ncbi:endo-beta-N-acetylglucosaminidase [Occultella kanbiaonis]|uniref:endo-beta-N-acetylglucosaminidase n=1 Tax=Occultella kanbiaonis TaxID=2675754 RepID=UPI0013D27953|nr:hypothetical protein [Occultella kanbiaonis]
MSDARFHEGPSTPEPPYAPAFYPGEVPVGAPSASRRSLLDWHPATDPDLPLLRSSVPLVNRAPRSARAPRVMSLAAFGTTAARSLQGGGTDRHYAFTHWALIDLLVVWGGSAAEGLIVVPEAPVVDAGHRAGVPVLGTVFLPQREHGGRPVWTDDLLARDGAGEFLLTGRLAEVAAVLGFDGWFVNAETQLEPDNATSAPARRTAAEMLAFVRDLSGRVDHMVWYDSLTRAGRIDWQDGVTDENRDFVARPEGAGPTEVFLNFNWAKSEGHVDATLAETAALGRDATDLFFGVDTESAGSDTSVRWDALTDSEGAPRGSIGIYRPEGSIRQLEHWSLEAFEQTEARYWEAREHPGPRVPGTWPGIATLAPHRPPHPLPIATAFTTGAGREYRVDGVASGIGRWYHLAVQDPMPPLRWVHEGGLTAALDWDDAWQAGESLRLTVGTGSGRVLVWQGPAGTLGHAWPVEVVASAGDVALALSVVDADGEQRVPLEPRVAVDEPTWRRWEGVVARAPRGNVSVHLEVAGAGTVRVGMLVLGDVSTAPPAPPSPLTARERADGVLLTWDRDPAVHHWEVLNGPRVVGLATAGAFRLAPGTATEMVSVRAVSPRWARSTPARPFS